MHNRTLIAPAVAASLVATLSACSAQEETAATSAATAAKQDAVLGTWRMTTLEDRASGSWTTTPYSGQIIISPSTVSVQAMNPDTSAPDGPYTVDGYEAFYGDVDIDDDSFSVDVESAAVRELIGQTLSRNYTVADDELVLTPTDPDETWRVTYERIDD